MREVWITDAGMVTAAGDSLEATWQTIMTGRTAIRKIDRFPVKAYRSELGASVSGIEPSEAASLIHNIMELLLCQIDYVPADSLLITASTKAGIDNLEKIKQGIAADPLDILPASMSDWVAEKLGLRGDSISINAACASSTAAVAQGAKLISSGAAESAVICCLDLITEFVFSGFSALQVLSPFPCRPFDRDRAGLSVGEGAAFITLMSAEQAKRFGCPQRGIIAGVGLSNDARHITAPDRNGAGLIRAVTGALKTAGVERSEIAGISAHGTGTIHNDLMELTAFQAVFEKYCPPIYSVKGCIGHTFGAAGGIEIALGTRILTEQTLPPTAGFVNPERGAEGLVSADSVPIKGDYLLATNSGFGGINAAIILKKGGVS
jgi:3-oxoacyl-[acyl-carrier-protein] synthase II